MCGIAGFWDTSGQTNPDRTRAIVRLMSNALIQRGPDDCGIWIEAESGIALGHRRLSIIDLSPEGHQPMVSADGRYTIVFNGEIYNFLELRRELEYLNYNFRGHSDTEVMLAAFSEWGLGRAVERFNGMFAFALWDKRERVLHLGRDRLGEKPLYYGWVGNTFLFASQLKAFQAYPGFNAALNRDALTLYLRHSYIPAPYSIYQNIYKLPPACTLSLCLDKNGRAKYFSPHSNSHVNPLTLGATPYWSVQAVAELGTRQSFTGSDEEAVEQLDTLLRDAVGLRMMADVPLGAFLSGGIDSSTVVALMQSQSCQPVKTFSIGFHESGYNEAQYARAVAQYLGTDHTELYVTPEEAIAVIPKLPVLYDEPFADSSQIPTFLVSQLARQQVTVSLSGDGGDELFQGYERYFLAESIWQKIGWMPYSLRKATSYALTSLSPQIWNRGISPIDALFPSQLRQRNLGDTLHKLAEVLAVPDCATLYRRVVSHWKEPEAIVLGGFELPTALSDHKDLLRVLDFGQWMMYLDSVTYLPDDILVKVDRASMGVSLEARVPLLDYRILEFAWHLPSSLKVRHGQRKWLLRQILYKYVPQSLIERPKMGFGVPIGNWLRGSLRDWAEALLDESRLRQEGVFNPRPIRQKWAEHLSGDRNWQYYLWDILMFQAWLHEQRRS